MSKTPLLLLLLAALSLPASAQLRGSIIEDRAARKLLEAGDARVAANETEKALEIWKSVLERYPRSKIRFDANMRLGDFFLQKHNDYESARGHYETAAAEDNPNLEQRAKATLNSGICFYEARHFGKCFQVMRKVIETYPTSKEVNQAYYYIGMGHFKQGHYSRAIEALEKVGTALTEDDTALEKLEAGKRLYIRIEDADLAILGPDETLEVRCTSTHGDQESVACRPVGRNVRVVLGSLPSALGKGVPNNGKLEVRGGDKIKVEYLDRHTADSQFNYKRLKEVIVVGDAVAQIMDGAYLDDLQGVVLGKAANLQITDADFDTTDGADQLQARALLLRHKTDEEMDAELAALVASGDLAPPDPDSDEAQEPQIDPWKIIDETTLSFREFDPAPPAETADAPSPDAPSPSLSPVKPPADDGLDDFLAEVEAEAAAIDTSIHSGIFRATIPLLRADEPVPGNPQLEALPADKIRLVFEDKLNRSPDPRSVAAEATIIEGNLGGVRVTRTEIGDEELRLKTRLRTASALCNIGNHYKEFGLDDKAKLKYQEALGICDEINRDANQLGGSFLEETYVQLWRIYFAMDELQLAAAISRRLQTEFPNSSFVDEALYQQAEIARKQGKLPNAIKLYQNLVALKNSSLRGEGQYGIAECYEQMAAEQAPEKSAGLFEKAFEEYRKVYTEHPDSGRVGDAVAKMANFYYQKKDYARAIDVFENVMTDHPDANFLDVILFNYGRCLYRLNKKAAARHQFDQLLNDYPDSELASEAKRISTALAKAGF